MPINTTAPVVTDESVTLTADERDALAYAVTVHNGGADDNKYLRALIVGAPIVAAYGKQARPVVESAGATFTNDNYWAHFVSCCKLLALVDDVSDGRGSIRLPQAFHRAQDAGRKADGTTPAGLRDALLKDGKRFGTVLALAEAIEARQGLGKKKGEKKEETFERFVARMTSGILNGAVKFDTDVADVLDAILAGVAAAEEGAAEDLAAAA